MSKLVPRIKFNANTPCIEHVVNNDDQCGVIYGCQLLSQPNSLPPNLKTILYVHSIAIIPGVLPPTITRLWFGRLYNIPLPPNVLPSSLTELKMSVNWDQPLEQGTLPQSITLLEFGQNFDQVLLPGVLPESLLSLTFGSFFQQMLAPRVLPSSLTYLEFDQSELPTSISPPDEMFIVAGSLPQSLQTLILPGWFQCLTKDMAPSSLKRLQYGFCTGVPAQGELPSNLEYISFKGLGGPLMSGTWPSSILKLKLPLDYSLNIVPGQLPPSLTKLTLRRIRKPSVSGAFPATCIRINNVEL
ncbi:hypothetical protein SAMD00019534_080060 [Acytostelium subglobosum LB1]|uniref:hypothetical protein n=1 Tax=Acytostelium subglobosum LB1 TaxID=1410327 RepID=UPI000645239B|nr:hypothetical protein SAMD00019534_080060 [Acytostelium subglobosum LB1]GAM24831.1 hypothetical protein SAMD00019534_080060 [Acytostelium subglobosum LB1]|eukprot:XP_012752500.1 hypothetical protein SAMD00019534_080060 [Acytostelium subglobosum LB1]